MGQYDISQAGFLTYVRGVVGITTQQLPDNSPVIPIAYQVAVDLVNQAVASSGFPLEYQLMVYNLGTSNLINFAPDNAGATAPTDKTYFSDLRKKFGTYDFTAGVVSSSGDNGTNESLQVSTLLNNLSLADLQYLKDPYGLTYMRFAMRFGTLWGLS